MWRMKESEMCPFRSVLINKLITIGNKKATRAEGPREVQIIYKKDVTSSSGAACWSDIERFGCGNQAHYKPSGTRDQRSCDRVIDRFTNMARACLGTHEKRRSGSWMWRINYDAIKCSQFRDHLSDTLVRLSWSDPALSRAQLADLFPFSARTVRHSWNSLFPVMQDVIAESAPRFPSRQLRACRNCPSFSPM